MKLQILSSIVAILTTSTSAYRLTCGDVKTLYQDNECCRATAHNQSCANQLTIPNDSDTALTLSNTGELKLNLTNFQSNYDTTQVLDGKLAGKLDNSVLNAVTTTDTNGFQFAEVNKYVRFDGGIQVDGFNAHGATRFLDTGSVSFESPITFNANAKLGKDAHKSSEYLPENIETYCHNTVYNEADYAHGFRSFWETAWGGTVGGGWEMHLGAGDFSKPTGCVLRRVKLGEAQLHTIGKIYGEQFLVVSDSRIKKDIVDADIEDALQKVRDIELKEYSYNDPNREGEKTVGFIAQQVKEVYPDAINIDIQSNTMHNEAGERVEIPDLHRVNKDKIFALHHGAIQSLDAKIAALEARLAALEAV